MSVNTPKLTADKPHMLCCKYQRAIDGEIGFAVTVVIGNNRLIGYQSLIFVVPPLKEVFCRLIKLPVRFAELLKQKSKYIGNFPVDLFPGRSASMSGIIINPQQNGVVAH